MKKQIALLATLMAVGSLSAFGQGFVAFSSGAAIVYNEYTTPGVGVTLNSSGIDATFLWAATTTVDPLGAGQASTGVTSAPGSAWTTVENMISSGGWTVAQNFSTSTEADNAPISTVGGLNYNANNSFDLAGITGGSVYQIVVIAWANVGNTIVNLSQAEQGGTVGWSSSFDYTSGASSSSPVNQMSSEGLGKFGVAPIPEPTTLALAGLGGLSMLFLRRRKA